MGHGRSQQKKLRMLKTKALQAIGNPEAFRKLQLKIQTIENTNKKS